MVLGRGLLKAFGWVSVWDRQDGNWLCQLYPRYINQPKPAPYRPIYNPILPFTTHTHTLSLSLSPSLSCLSLSLHSISLFLSLSLSLSPSVLPAAYPALSRQCKLRHMLSTRSSIPLQHYSELARLQIAVAALLQQESQPHRK